MAVKIWQGATGSQPWSTTGNWQGGTPVNGDDVFILSGSSSIDSGLNQSAVTLASLTVAGSFSGTIQSAADLPLPLQIGVSGTALINCPNLTAASFDFGSTNAQVVVDQTGPAVTNQFGGECLRIRGGGSTAALFMAGSSSVGVATDTAGITATLASWNINGGTLNMSSGVTWTNGYQSGGTVSVNSAGTLIQQSGSTAVVVIGGTGKVATINISANGVISNRPASGVAYDTLTIGANGTADHSQDPRSITITNPIFAFPNSNLVAFEPGQIQIASGPAPLAVKMPGGPGSVGVQLGAEVLATFTSY